MEKIPIERFKMTHIKNEPVPLRNWPIKKRIRAHDVEESVTSSTSRMHALDQAVTYDCVALHCWHSKSKPLESRPYSTRLPSNATDSSAFAKPPGHLILCGLDVETSEEVAAKPAVRSFFFLDVSQRSQNIAGRTQGRKVLRDRRFHSWTKKRKPSRSWAFRKSYKIQCDMSPPLEQVFETCLKDLTCNVCLDAPVSVPPPDGDIADAEVLPVTLISWPM